MPGPIDHMIKEGDPGPLKMLVWAKGQAVVVWVIKLKWPWSIGFAYEPAELQLTGKVPEVNFFK